VASTAQLLAAINRLFSLTGGPQGLDQLERKERILRSGFEPFPQLIEVLMLLLGESRCFQCPKNPLFPH